jgi:sec-independent protein translocase protein TatA
MGIGNPVHLIFLAAIALVVLGPKRLPEMARSLGDGMRQFRESMENAGEEHHAPASGAHQAQIVAAEPALAVATPLAQPAVAQAVEPAVVQAVEPAVVSAVEPEQPPLQAS